MTTLPGGQLLGLGTIYSLIEGEMRSVDAVIRQRLHSEVPLVSQVGNYIVASGGKRIRPALLLLSARAVGYRGERHHELAAVIEFIHTATLLHDDVVDESSLRRGKKTANAEFGNAASVLVGDFLYSRAFQMMVSVGSMRVMEVLAEATNIIAEGEVLQLMNCRNADIGVDDYLRVIRYKTAKLFEASARLGAILGEGSRAIEEALAAYGKHLGTAFQIIDDVLDYSGDEGELGKSPGNDLAEGKPTLPLIYVMQQGRPEQAALVRAALENSGGGSFAPIMAAVRESGALDAAREIARREAGLAKQAIADMLPDTQHRTALLELADFAVARQF